jgi:hypothetical protein
LREIDATFRPRPYAGDVRATVDWLNARPVGATLVEFVQRLPTDEAEKVHAAALELKRLEAEEQRHAKTARNIQSWSWIGGIVGVAAIDASLRGSIGGTLLLVTDGMTVATIWWFASRAIRQEYALAGRQPLSDSASKRLSLNGLEPLTARQRVRCILLLA